jgi:hypothetical protein
MTNINGSREAFISRRPVASLAASEKNMCGDVPNESAGRSMIILSIDVLHTEVYASHASSYPKVSAGFWHIISAHCHIRRLV